MVKLKSNEKKIFEVPIDILWKSKLISGIVEDASDQNREILLKYLNNKQLEKVIEYLQHYKNIEPKQIPKPFPTSTDDDFLRSILNDDWTFNYVQSLSLEETMLLMNCSYYLEINGLYEILGAKVAHEMANCDVEEARKKFGIECDMTEEEMAEIDKYPLD